MGLLDSYQESTNTALTVMASRPLEADKPEPKRSAWTAPFRAVAAGAAEVAGNVMDTAGAFGQVSAAAGGITPGFDPDARKNRQASIDAMETLKTEGINWRTDEAQQAYKFGADLRPDPLTAGTAENLVFGLTKGLTKAIGAASTLGPVGGAAAFGASEGLAAAEDLATQGVDQATRTKVGAVTGIMSAAGVALPVAGKTLEQTAGLVLAGGPASFIAQQAATREILRNADYQTIAEQYDPLDPVGLTVATLLPAGFAAYAKRGGFGAKPSPKADGQPLADGAPAVQETGLAATPEAMDAAMVQNLTMARDEYEKQIAYHGSPYSFDVFSKTAIGTGEGNAAFGHGFYFTETKSIAEWYRDTLSFGYGTLVSQIMRKHLGNKKSAIADLESQIGSSSDESNPFSVFAPTDQAIKEAIDKIKSPSLYEVQIPSEKTLLLWDKPISDQPSGVMDALKKAGIDVSKSSSINSIFDSFGIDSDIQPDNASMFYRDMAVSLGSDAAASKFLKDIGVNGIKYFDGQSRGNDSGAFNYVVFDESDISIISKDGTPTVKESLTVQPESGNPASPEVTPDTYRARVDALLTEQPDLIARLDDAGQPVKLSDELAAIKKQAQEGTDTDFGALDAPLLKVAAECALSFGGM